MGPLLTLLSVHIAQTLCAPVSTALQLQLHSSHAEHALAEVGEDVWALRATVLSLGTTAAAQNATMCMGLHSHAILKGALRAAGRSRDSSASLSLLHLEPTLCKSPRRARAAAAACASALAHFDAAAREHASALLCEWGAPLRTALQGLDDSLRLPSECSSASSSGSGGGSSAGNHSHGAVHMLAALQRQAVRAARALRARLKPPQGSEGAGLATALSAALQALRQAVKPMRQALAAHLPARLAEEAALHALAATLGRIQDLSSLAAALGREVRSAVGKRGAVRRAVGALSAAAARLAHSAAQALRTQWFSPLPANATADAAGAAPTLLSALLGTLSQHLSAQA